MEPPVSQNKLSLNYVKITITMYTLVEAWQWKKEDHIPLFLPLHHIHGIINSLLSPLYQGAKVTIKFF